MADPLTTNSAKFVGNGYEIAKMFYLAISASSMLIWTLNQAFWKLGNILQSLSTPTGKLILPIQTKWFQNKVWVSKLTKEEDQQSLFKSKSLSMIFQQTRKM